MKLWDDPRMMLILLIIVIFIILLAMYGNKPMDEVPLWVWWLLH